jgi:hypothetical protein
MPVIFAQFLVSWGSSGNYQHLSNHDSLAVAVHDYLSNLLFVSLLLTSFSPWIPII